MRKFFIPIILALVLLSTPAWAASYYVAQTQAGDFSGSSCANAKSLSTFNTTANSGDTATMCDGTFTTQIIPTNSGSSGSPITYIADTQYAAVVSTSGVAANLSNKTYITMDGLYFNDCGSRWLTLNNSAQTSNHIIIRNCKFYDAAAYAGFDLEKADYNQFIDNVFLDAPNSGDANGTKPADFININEGSDHNLVKGNTFGDCAHENVYIRRSNWNVVKNNTFNNQYHTGASSNSIPGVDSTTLVEGNIFADVGANWTSNPLSHAPSWEQPAIYVSSRYSIIRKNIVYGSGTGLYILSKTAGGTATTDNSLFYNNTLYDNERNVYESGDGVTDFDDHWFKNNLIDNASELQFYSGNSVGTCMNYYDYNMFTKDLDTFSFKGGTDESIAILMTDHSAEWLSHNFEGDANFVDAAGNDFTLQGTSDAIDAGVHLTEVNDPTHCDAGSEDCRFMIVDDSRYFYDGWGITGETADYVYVDNPPGYNDFIEQIDSINYGTHTITLLVEHTHRNNAKVYVAYSSIVGYYGNEIDIGALEYTGNSPPTINLTNPNGTLACNADPNPFSLQCETDVNCYCQWCEDGVAGCDALSTYDDAEMTQFETGEGTQVLHAHGLSEACGATYKYRIVCKALANALVSAQSEANFTISGGAPPQYGGSGSIITTSGTGILEISGSTPNLIIAPPL